MMMDLHALPEEPDGDYDDKPPAVVEGILHLSEPGRGEPTNHSMFEVGEGVAEGPETSSSQQHKMAGV